MYILDKKAKKLKKAIHYATTYPTSFADTKLSLSVEISLHSILSIICLILM